MEECGLGRERECAYLMFKGRERERERERERVREIMLLRERVRARYVRDPIDLFFFFKQN